MQALRTADSRRLVLKAPLPALILGFMATSFQVYLLREFSAQFYGNELNYGFVLASWLLWGGLGSLLAGRRKKAFTTETLAAAYTIIPALLLAGFLALRFSRQLLGRLPGEAVGTTPALSFALGLSLLVSFPLGACFVINARLRGGDSSRIYFLESLGAAVAGAAVQFILVPGFPNWTGTGIVAFICAGASVIALKPKRPLLHLAAAVIVATSFITADLPLHKLAWKPLNLIESFDTRFGKLQVFMTGGQLTLASNGLPMFSYPDPAAAEETVHFTLPQRPGLGKVLLVGGGAGGAAAEVLKYSGVALEYVELDPGVIQAALRHLPEEARAALQSPRMKIIYDDGRRFIKRAGGLYDVVLVSLPEPATAQVNRFYTVEFFREVKRVLAPNGVISLTAPASENYLSPDLARFLAGLAGTLRMVFRNVDTVPGGNCVFLASDGPLTIDPDELADRLERAGVNNSFVTRTALRDRLNPMRVEYLDSRLRTWDVPVNRDLTPVGYFFHSIWWASQFKGPEAAALRFFAGQPIFRVLDLPLILIAALLLVPAATRRRRASACLVPVAVLGVTSIVVEISIIMAFQASFGYLYGTIALLLGSFMAGLSLGSLTAIRRRSVSPRELWTIQALKAVLLGLILISLGRTSAEFLPFLFLGLEGALSGRLFVAANRLYPESERHPGAAYSVDLIGSFLGALIAASIIIPLWGVPALMGRLLVLNIVVLVFTILSFRPRAGSA